MNGMKFKIKETLTSYQKTFTIEATAMHGDGDFNEIITFGPFNEERENMLFRYKKVLDNMLASDKETGNNRNYSNVRGFYELFQNNDEWKKDKTDPDRSEWAYIRNYKIFYYDENGTKHEIEDVEMENTDKHTYICVSFNIDSFYILEGYLVKTDEPLADELKQKWKLVELENHKEWLNQFDYGKEEEIEDPDEEEFCILAVYSPNLKTEEKEETFYSQLEEWENKHFSQ